MNSHIMNKVKKDIVKIFKEFCLAMMIITNLSAVNFLGLNIELSMDKFYPNNNPSVDTVYVHMGSINPHRVIEI